MVALSLQYKRVNGTLTCIVGMAAPRHSFQRGIGMPLLAVAKMGEMWDNSECLRIAGFHTTRQGRAEDDTPCLFCVKNLLYIVQKP